MLTLLFIAVALVGVLLIVVPRVRRRRGRGGRAGRLALRPRRARAPPPWSAPAATRTWSGGDDELDDWDDDLGWVDDAPRASAPAPQPEPAARFAPADATGGGFAWPERGAAATEAANAPDGRAAAPAVTARAADAERPPAPRIRTPSPPAPRRRTRRP